MSESELNAKESVITAPYRCMNWRNIIFFAVTHLTAIIGIPAYIYVYGPVPADTLWLTAFYFISTGLSITVGYHRLFAHRTYNAHAVVRFWALFFGAASFEESALTWASQHRIHHQYTDTDLDPYNIKKGFFYAHMGWMMFWKHPKTQYNVKDLRKSRLMIHQHNYYIIWGSIAGIIIPMLIGGMFGHWFEAAIFAVCGRITGVYQGTFCINSVCHMFGRSTYDITSTAKDNWVNALFTWGEGYHNFHHRFPNDYRNGVRWYQWDPSKWTIFLLKGLGLAENLKRTSWFTILNARLLAENKRAEIHLADLSKRWEQVAVIREKVQNEYDRLVTLLREWENRVKSYALLKKERHATSPQILKLSFERLRETRKNFLEARREWIDLVSHKIYFPHLISLPA